MHGLVTFYRGYTNKYVQENKRILPPACPPHHQTAGTRCACAQDVRKTGTRGSQDLEGGSYTRRKI